jgi:hypothetical protein
MTPEMLELAQRNQAESGVENAEFLLGTMEEIPLPDASVDVVICNCVINLAADKDRVLAVSALMDSTNPDLSAFAARGGSGTGYSWSVSSNVSGGSVDPTTGAYKAGPAGSVSDVVAVYDSLGNTATALVFVGTPLTIAPSTSKVAPNDTLQLSATGGTPPTAWTITANRSGGSIDANGKYKAGPTPNVTDIVTATDKNGASGTATLAVGPGVSIAPADPTVVAGGVLQLSSTGGSGTGHKWSVGVPAGWTVPGAPIGGSVDSSTGAYTAPSKAGLDVVEVTDSVGNVALTTVVVTLPDGGAPDASAPPANDAGAPPPSPSSGAVNQDAGCSLGAPARSSGPASAGVVSLVALLALRRRRRAA